MNNDRTYDKTVKCNILLSISGVDITKYVNMERNIYLPVAKDIMLTK